MKQMKNQIKFIILGFVILLFTSILVSCNDADADSETQQNQEEQTSYQKENAEEEQNAFAGQNLRIIGNKVNVRSEPSIKADIVTQLMINEEFEIEGKTDDTETISEQTDYWYKIEKNGQKGWVFGALTSETLNEKTNFDSDDATLEILGDKVNVRSEPSIKGKVLFQLKMNEVVEVKKQSENYETVGEQTDYWYQIEKDGKRGWVFGSFTSRMLIYEGCSG